MSGGGGSSTTTVKELSPEQRELLELVIPVARETSENPPELFPGSTIAPFDPLQQLGQAQAVGTAFNFLQPLAESTTQGAQNVQGAIGPSIEGLGGLIGGIPAAQQTGQFLLGGALLDPRTNPVLGAQTEAAIRPIAQQFSQHILPNIRSGAIEAGQFGGSRQGIAEGLAGQEFLQQASEIATNLQANNFNQGLGAMQAALDSVLGAGLGGVRTGLEEGTRSLFAAPTLADLALRPAEVVSGVGDIRQQMDQARLTEEADRFLTEQLIPFLVAQDIANLAFGIPAGSTSVQQSSSLSPLQTIGGILSPLAAIAGLF